MSETKGVRIAIAPEPNDREAAAIVAAVVAISGNVADDEAKPSVNRWREAGKREALRESIWEKKA